jgi:hypothetical protein
LNSTLRVRRHATPDFVNGISKILFGTVRQANTDTGERTHSLLQSAVVLFGIWRRQAKASPASGTFSPLGSRVAPSPLYLEQECSPPRPCKSPGSGRTCSSLATLRLTSTTAALPNSTDYRRTNSYFMRVLFSERLSCQRQVAVVVFALNSIQDTVPLSRVVGENLCKVGTSERPALSQHPKLSSTGRRARERTSSKGAAFSTLAIYLITR